MTRAIVCAAIALFAFIQTAAAEWRLEILPTPGPVKAIDASTEEPLIAIGGGWFRLVAGTNRITLAATAGPPQRPMPEDALPDGRVAYGKRNIARAWLAEPTDRYRHGVLGDAIEAASLIVERRDGAREVIRAGDDAVFEDLEPRIAELDDSGREFVVVVKSYLAAGSALAVIGERDGRFAILAETTPIGTAQRWLNPAGAGDFFGDGSRTLALVQMPHVLGQLQLWDWLDGRLAKRLELSNTSNHVAGSRVLRMSAITDFDGDGSADLAIPSFDRRELRLVSFAPAVRDIARLKLPARAVTELAAIKDHAGNAAVILGLENGALAIARLAR